MMETTLLEKTTEDMGIVLSKEQLEQFVDYYKLLVEWNEKINLTAITEWEDVCIKHFADSLSLNLCYNSFNDFNQKFSRKTLCDVGTGAGFPGIPLKILFPELEVSLFDSLEKRVKFLNEVISKLSLQKIDAVHGRAEELAFKKEYREKFDYATARAVASLPVLSEYCLPFVKPGGFFVAYKSEKAPEEIESSVNALKILKGEVSCSKSFVLPGTELGRNIILIRKTGNITSKYPRKAGTPSKQPL